SALGFVGAEASAQSAPRGADEPVPGLLKMPSSDGVFAPRGGGARPNSRLGPAQRGWPVPNLSGRSLSIFSAARNDADLRARDRQHVARPHGRASTSANSSVYGLGNRKTGARRRRPRQTAERPIRRSEQLRPETDERRLQPSSATPGSKATRASLRRCRTRPTCTPTCPISGTLTIAATLSPDGSVRGSPGSHVGCFNISTSPPCAG